MGITKGRLQQIIKEEVARATGLNEAYGRRGYGGYGRYGGYSSSRMSDSEARSMGARGYDEPADRGPRHKASGGVHSTVHLYIGEDQEPMLRAALARFDSSLILLLDQGYDSVAGGLIDSMDPVSGYYKQGPKWRLAKEGDQFTFTVTGVTGTGATPTEALADAASQGGWPGSSLILAALS